MKKTFAALLAGALFLCILNPLFAEDSVTKAQNSTVIVRATIDKVYDPESGMPSTESQYVGICSGFVIATNGTDELIVTAKHCTTGKDIEGLLGTVGVELLTPTYVQFFDGDVGVVKAVSRSQSFDLAVLLVHSNRRHPKLALSNHMRTAEKLFVFGMPLGIPWSYSTAVSMSGILRSPHEKPFDNLVQIECPSCGGGDSGAGVFNTSGRIVGVLVAGDGAAHSLIVPTEDLLEFIGSL